MGRVKGIARELAAAAGDEIAKEAANAAGAQVELFGLPCADKTGRIADAVARQRKAGRPPGSSDATTKALRDYLLRRGVLPQQSLMQWFMLGPEGLAVALGCNKLDAFREWRALGDALGRYFMAPMQPVDGEGNALPVFNVLIGGQAGLVGANGAVLPPWSYMDGRPEQNQQVIQGDDEQSQKDESQK